MYWAHSADMRPIRKILNSPQIDWPPSGAYVSSLIRDRSALFSCVCSWSFSPYWMYASYVQLPVIEPLDAGGQLVNVVLVGRRARTELGKALANAKIGGGIRA